VYEDALANIMFLKQQQWMTTNYTILIYAAIFAIANLIPLYDWEIHVLAGFVMSSFFVSNVILDRMQRSLSKFRSRLIFINSVYFTDEERVGLNAKVEPKSYYHDWQVIVGLIGVTFFGAAVTLYFLPSAHS
jgi:hypothetical protein